MSRAEEQAEAKPAGSGGLALGVIAGIGVGAVIVIVVVIVALAAHFGNNTDGEMHVKETQLQRRARKQASSLSCCCCWGGGGGSSSGEAKTDGKDDKFMANAAQARPRGFTVELHPIDQKHDDTAVLPPISIEMHRSDGIATLKVMVDPHSFASGSSATDDIAANAAKEGRDRVDTDILAGQDMMDDEYWE